MVSQRQHRWDRRWKWAEWIRDRLRRRLFNFVESVGQTDDGRAAVARALKGLIPGQLPWAPPAPAPEPPYPELGRALPNRTGQRSDVVFITARFRSGSTLLWNLFRHLEGYTSYYEPLNERRWFDPATRGSHIDATHKNAEEYWREYEGLGALGAYYREDWIERNLYMGDDFWDPDLKQYLTLMVEKAPGRPVLQFNRVDFRLPWLRRNFPNARLIHLYRHPRDQWCSSLLDIACFPRTGSVAQFAPHDKFYLLTWARDLRHHFPFLDEKAVEHPYQLFYYLWKLSYLFGLRYAHHSLAFEHLVTDSQTQLEALFRTLDVPDAPLDKLKALLVKPALGKWRDYADDAWFRGHEEACETVLQASWPQPVP